jgi:transcriptional antiterminator RfaH
MMSERTECSAEKLEWFCVRSQPKHEHVAARNLRRLLGLDVVNPRIRFRRATVRGAVWVTESVFPNYLFARFDRAESLRDVQHTFGVAGIVHFGVFWPALPDAVVDDMRSMLGPDELRVLEEELKPGDEIQIAGGAFHGLRAVVSRLMPAKARVAVLLNFLGRDTHTEIKLADVVRVGPRFLAKVA